MNLFDAVTELMPKEHSPDESPTVDPTRHADTQRALEKILCSAGFSKAPRMARLLRYLVDKSLSGATSALTETAIGLAVFDRDPATYYSPEDPIVRVQTGRLREKLRRYYAGEGTDALLRITLAQGSYRPLVQTAPVRESILVKNYLLALQQVRCLTVDVAAQGFADGLSEELANQLFNAFGNLIVSPTFGAASRTLGAASHHLEGSIRLYDQHIRASFRLIDAAAGCIAWSAQFDRAARLDIEAEELLAQDICSALKAYYCQGT